MSVESAMPFDPDIVRKDFPALGQTIHGDKPLVYLDNAATTQKPAPVLRALQEYYEQYNSNVHRALHLLAQRATEAYEGTRAKVAGFINAPDPLGVVFTRGTTESINLVAQAWGRATLREGDEIVLTEMEHHSNLVPWQMIAAEKGAVLRFVPLREDGSLDLEAYGALLGNQTRMVAVTHMSNVLGTVNPVKEIVAKAHEAGALTLIDGAQSVPHFPVDVDNLDADFYTFSGHKMLAPTGIGVLWGRPELLEAMPPYQGGGEMILKVDLEASTYADVPHKFEAGTPPIAGAVGLSAAIDYLEEVGMESVREHEEDLTAYTIEQLGAIDGLTIHGRAPDRGGAISFSVEGIHPHDLSQYVDGEGVAIRGGHMCCQPLMRRLKVPALSRASLYLYNDRADIDRLVEAVVKAKEFFRYD